MAAIAVANSAKGVGSTPITTASFTSTTKNTLIAVAVWDGTNSFTSITDSFLNTWIQIGSEIVSGGVRSRIYYVEICNGGASHTATLTLSSGSGTLFFVELSGTRYPGTYDATPQAQGTDTSSPFTVTSGTFTKSNELAIASIGGDSTVTATVAESSGFSIFVKEEDGTLNWAGAVASKTNSGTGALTPSWTQTGSANTVLYIVAFGGGPRITVDPATQYSYIGLTATFTITATSSGGVLHYQWKDDGVNVGTDSSSYTTAALVSGDDSSLITCDVTDDNGIATCHTAYLFVQNTSIIAWIIA